MTCATRLELVLSADIIRMKDISWGVDFNISHIRNKVLSLPDDIKTTEIEGYNGYVNDDPSFVSKYKYFVAEGLSLYTWYLPKYAGVDSETGEALFYKDVTDEARSGHRGRRPKTQATPLNIFAATLCLSSRVVSRPHSGTRTSISPSRQPSSLAVKGMTMFIRFLCIPADRPERPGTRIC